MSGLPEGWTTARLADFTTKVGSGATPRGGESSYQSTGIPLIRSMNVVFFGFKRQGIAYLSPAQASALQGAEVYANDVLLNITGASIGRATIAPPDIAGARVNQHVCIIRPGPEVDPRYLNGYLSSPLMQKLITEENYGVTRQALTKQQILDFEIPLAPLPEQKRIADKLDTLLACVDACREHLDRVPAILKRFRQSVLAAATSGELTRDWRDANHAIIDSRSLAQKLHAAHAAAGGHKAGNAAPPTEGAHDLTPDMFPTSWSLVTLRDLVQPDRPITYGILKPGPELDDGVPYVRVADFPGERLNLTSIRKTSPAMDEEFKRSRLAAGDLLLSIRGTVGRVVIIPPALEKANITQDSARLSIQTCVSATFVLWALRSELVQQRMRGAIKGVAVRGMNIGDVRALQIPLPSREEQNEIARRVESLFTLADQLETRYTTARANINRLTPSLLAKAFRGDLVPQDPNDEPAAALLARIAAARQTAPERLGAKVGRRRGGRHAHAD